MPPNTNASAYGPTASEAAHSFALQSAKPYFWRQPIRYLRYASHTSPALFWSVVIGGAFPLVLLAIPVRRALGDEDAPAIPMSWPVPNRKREPVPDTYDD